MEGVTVVYKINDEEVSIEKYNAEMEENWPDNSEIEESGKYSGQYDLTPENVDAYCWQNKTDSPKGDCLFLL